MTSAPTIRVLFTEDVAADAELEMRELKRAGLRFTHRIVQSEESFAEALREFSPDVILSDFSMPGFDGMSALALAREMSPDTPFVFVSGTIGEEYAIRALKSGATDYVLKTNLVRLPAAVERAIADARERRERRRAEAELEIARERLTSIFTSLPDMLWSVDTHTDQIIYVSPAAREIFGHAPDEFLHDQQLWLNAVHPEDRPRVLEAWQSVRQDGSFDLEYRAVRPDGAIRWVHDRGRQIRGAHGKVERVDGLARDITAEVEKRDRIAYLALYDNLTGLPNRSSFHERLVQALQMAHGTGGKLALTLIDLERFKAINDTLGHPVGDALLKAVAQRLREAAGGDINRVARLGPDVFALMFQHFSDVEEIARQLEGSAAINLGEPFHIDGREISVAAKAGIAVYPDDGGDADALLGNAEAALQRAKETGERYLFYAPTINARVSEQVELEHRLRKAVERGELFLHFQPKLDLVTRQIVGLEALMRWQPPEGGLVSPVKFVPVLEQTGLILEAGRQAIARASAMYRTWTSRGLNPPRIAVNVSAMQLRRRGFAADVHDALVDAGGDGGGIDLEITESLLMTEIDESIRKLREVRAMGITIALDDFGTGYSSLAYLSKLPIDSLKIDRGFVRGMTENADDTSIISIIISLAQALRLKVVAEGVESEQQAQLLRLLRCDQAQGYLFSPPVASERIEAMLRSA